jgi:hypothetical protein
MTTILRLYVSNGDKLHLETHLIALLAWYPLKAEATSRVEPLLRSPVGLLVGLGLAWVGGWASSLLGSASTVAEVVIVAVSCSVSNMEKVDPGAKRSMSSRVIGSRKADIMDMSFKLKPESILQAALGAVDDVNETSDSFNWVRLYTLDLSRASSKSFLATMEGLVIVMDCLFCDADEMEEEEESTLLTLRKDSLLEIMDDASSKNLTERLSDKRLPSRRCKRCASASFCCKTSSTLERSVVWLVRASNSDLLHGNSSQ